MKEYQLQKAVCKYLDLNNVLYCGSMGGNYQAHISQRIKAKNLDTNAVFLTYLYMNHAVIITD